VRDAVDALARQTSAVEADGEMDTATADMAPPQPINALGKLIKRVGKRPKIGRNEKCPRGSGKKYKKCHLLKGGWQ
jgi:uncharacterized protein YecA (UPF0149 family)